MAQENLPSSFSDFGIFYYKNIISAPVAVLCFHEHYWNTADFSFF